MNEMALMMHILSKQSNVQEMGATKKEILEALAINHKNKNGNVYFYEIITNIAKYIEPLGLQIRFNPLDSHWFISYDSELSDLISANPFENKPRLAATLFCSLMCCLKNMGIAKINDIRELRKKKDLIEDLRELEEKGYITIDSESNKVRLTPLIGYQLDVEKLYTNIALNQKCE